MSSEKCPICGEKYNEKNYEVDFHIKYPNEKIKACQSCNFAEFFIRRIDPILTSEDCLKLHWKEHIEKVKKYLNENSN